MADMKVVTQEKVQYLTYIKDNVAYLEKRNSESMSTRLAFIERHNEFQKKFDRHFQNVIVSDTEPEDAAMYKDAEIRTASDVEIKHYTLEMAKAEEEFKAETGMSTTEATAALNKEADKAESEADLLDEAASKDDATEEVKKAAKVADNRAIDADKKAGRKERQPKVISKK